MLLQCGVLPATFTHIASMPSSRGCDVEFTSHAAGMYARSKVIAMALSFYERDSSRVPVWLGVGKTRDEMKPSRMTHWCQDVVTSIEAEKDDPQTVLKCLKGKFCSLGSITNRIGFSMGGTWRWSKVAVARYSQDELDMASAYIEGS